MPESKVVVIGSGPGRIRLRGPHGPCGHQVVVMEKNGFPGGKCSSLRHDATWSIPAVHMFRRGQHGPFGDIARILGEGPSWSAKTPSFTLSLPGGRQAGHGSPKCIPCRSRVHRGAPAGLAEHEMVLHCRQGHKRSWVRRRPLPGQALKRQGATPLGELQDVDRARLLHPALRIRRFPADLPCHGHADHGPPWHRASMESSLTYSPATMRVAQLCYPYGGSGAIPGSFLHALTARGGELRLAASARIESGGGRVRGVTTVEGEFVAADTVVSNAGLKRTIAMSGREAFPAEYLARADGLRDSEAFTP